jgi:hypothetical protein
MTTIRRLVPLLLVAAVAQELGAQDTKLGGFADVTVNASDRRGEPWAFHLGQFDLYLTSRLADRISFLSEVVFEYDDGFVSDVERVIVTFSPRSYLRVSLGKHHTPIGYWNNAYHHGELIQPTIGRPLFFKFEDEGGILPIHTTGLLIAGRDISPLHLGYDVMVGNGIGSTPVADNDQAKSYTLAMHSQVTSGLRIGASVYLDRIAAGALNLSGAPLAQAVRERIIGGFAVYEGPAWQLMGEWQRSTNETASGSSTATDGFYVYAGYRRGDLTVYALYQELRYPPADPYYVVDDARLAFGGARYDFAPTATLKVEVRGRRTALAGAATEVGAQLAVGF